MEENHLLIEINLSKSIYIALKKRPIDTETIEKFISNISRSLKNLVKVKYQLIQLGQWLWMD